MKHPWIVLCLLLVGGAAVAAPSPRVDLRQHAQGHRISHGVHQGTLTRREAQGLAAQQWAECVRCQSTIWRPDRGRRAASRTAAATSLEAHQLQVLVSAGDPEAARAAPTWRRVGTAS